MSTAKIKARFLWVEFQLRDLCEAESDYGIRLVLENLPRSLSETYDRLLRRIEGPERRSMILRMFKWIVCARQPLHVDQIREGIAFTLEDKEWSQDKIPTNLSRLIRACGNLVIVDAGTQIVQLAHYTVQQYLLRDEGGSFHFSLKDAHAMAGEFCLAYLSFTCFETQVTRYRSNTNTELAALQTMAANAAFVAPDHPGRRVIQAWNTMRGSRAASSNLNIVNLTTNPKLKADSMSAYCFLEYVVVHWLWHTVDFVSSPRTSRRDQIFKNLVCWKDLLFDFRPWPSFDKSRYRSSSISLFGWALIANHGYLLRMVSMEMEHFMPKQLVIDAWLHIVILGPDDRLVLHNSDVEFLMTLQQEHCSSNSASESPLWLLSQLLLACQRGHLRVLKAVDINDICKVAPHVGTHLPQFLILLTAGTGQLDTIKYLTGCMRQVGDEGLHAIWDTPTSWRNSLQRAFESRQFDTVLYLSSTGYKADGFSRDVETYVRLLASAVSTGDSEAAECLVDPSIMPFMITPEELADVFVLTVQKGFLAVVAGMLQCGVDPNIPDGNHYLPIVQAIRSRNQEMVSLLLCHGCSPGATRFGLPLTIAAAMGDLAICTLLIANGAEVFHGSINDVHAMAMVSLGHSQRETSLIDLQQYLSSLSQDSASSNYHRSQTQLFSSLVPF